MYPSRHTQSPGILFCTPDSDSEFAGHSAEGVVVGGSVAAGVVCGTVCALDSVVEPADVAPNVAGEEVEAAGTGVVGTGVEARDVVCPAGDVVESV